MNNATEPLKSIRIRKRWKNGIAYKLLSPEEFDGAETFTFRKGKMKIYDDKSGRNKVPTEWKEYGMAIAAHRPRGCNHIRYVCLSDKKKTLLDKVYS